MDGWMDREKELEQEEVEEKRCSESGRKGMV